ncbi:MAG: hypothetical protein OEN22_00080 [Gammaproteobacteria bacterium]|nr:hypothetical protein [Gammaproteobacteria bacterium]
MIFFGQFDDYIARFRRRLKSLVAIRGFALVAGAATLITIVAVAIANRTGFSSDLIIAARFVLFGSLAAVVYFYIIQPRRHIDEHGSQAIEARTPAFGGRVETYLDMRDMDNPLRDLLAEDALYVARRYPPDEQVRAQEFRLAWIGASVAVLTLLVLAIAGPGNYAFGVRQLWVGWAFPGLLPPQSIEVSPGDGGIRLGGNLQIAATLRGFTSDKAVVNVSFDDGEWQQVPMIGDERDFEFMFFSVREPLEYYVSANNVRSPTFAVDVVDLPVVEKLVLTYHYPEWTGRDPEVRDPGGDVKVVEHTAVDVQVAADRPMTPGELIVDDRVIPLRITGSSATATFTVLTDGQYHVVARVGGERIRLTDDYFITAQDDEPPTIEFARPGRDWSASRIEEVTTKISASDDFGIESLALRYSVNGGDWEEIALGTETTEADAEHVFLLESLSQTDAEAPLAPGDLIAYYAIAEDRDSSARTDMFFVDVQPFDRRYTQSQAGGAMGGMQGGQQDEVSQRQREIIISTWNLIREQNENRRDDAAYVTDNAALLSRLQATLKEQVETLARRTEARQLTATDEDIARFVEHLRKAADAMAPAAQRLGAIELEQALLPEQEALQHLLAAEAVFTDISVSLQANSRGGGQAGRDLTDMFELEMDLEKNQYETGSKATPDPPQQQMQETADELAELARRQEQLARNQGLRQSQIPAQRWQQEMLRRDVEELRERLEQLAQSAANDRAQASSSAGDSGSTDGPAQSMRGEALDREIDALQRRLDSAVRAMNDADAAMSENASPLDLQRAMEEAQRQLEGARDRASSARQQGIQASANDLAERAAELHESQAGLEQKLQDAVRTVLSSPENADRSESGMTVAEEYNLAAEKRELLSRLEGLQLDALNVAKDLERDQPRAAEMISDGIENLQELQIEARIAVAAAYIERGQGIYVAASESAVTEGLRELRDDLSRAERLVAGGTGTLDETGRDALDNALAETQQLRRTLQRLADGSGDANRFAEQGRDDPQRPPAVRAAEIDAGRDVARQAADVSRGVSGLLRDLADAGVGARDIDELRQLAADIRAAEFSGNPDLLDREARRALTLVEQLELALARSTRRDDGGVRVSADTEIPEAYRDIVADYYRRLGSAEDTDE